MKTSLSTHCFKIATLGLMSLALSIVPTEAASVAVTAVGISSTSTNLNWVTNGNATLNGATSGVAWDVSGERQGVDWEFDVAKSTVEIWGHAPGTVEWPTAGRSGIFGYVAGGGGTLCLDILSGMIAGVIADGKDALLISCVAPEAGAYVLDGVSITATSTGQVLQWTAPLSELAAGDLLVFTNDGSHTATSGPIGFSSTMAVPEPSTWAMLVGGMGLLAFGQRLRRRNA